MSEKSKKPIGPVKKGALHEQMGVIEGKKIPTKDLEKIVHSKDASPLEKKRAQFALNAKKWDHSKK